MRTGAGESILPAKHAAGHLVHQGGPESHLQFLIGPLRVWLSRALQSSPESRSQVLLCTALQPFITHVKFINS